MGESAMLAATPAVLADSTSSSDEPKTSSTGKDCNCDATNWPNPCGPTCLKSVLKYFGVDSPAEAAAGDIARDAAGMAQIQKACERAGLHTRQVRLDVQTLQRLLISYPSVRAILALKEGHFDYAEAAREGEFRFVTLSGESRWCPADKLAARWPGEALVISRQPLPGDLAELSVARDQAPPTAAAQRSAPLRVVFYNSPSCHECQRVKGFLPQVKSRWGERIVVELRSVDDINVFDELFKYEKQYGATVTAPPAIFVGDKALVGDEVIIAQLNGAIEKAIAAGAATFNPAAAPASPSQAGSAGEQAGVPSEILRRFESFGPGAVAIAGLIDGVNPCAFTTIVFFLSMLAYLKKTRRDMILVGAGFTVGMFAAYFLLGLGLLGAVKVFSVSHGLSTGLACGVAILAFALAGWSLLDAVRCMRSGDSRQATLGLPKKVKERIHKIIRTGLTTRGLVIGSLSVGFLVSIFESLCTGQIYLPTIVFMTRTPGMKTAAVGYLLLYNVMFILPLVGILAMSYFGVRSEALGNMLRKRLALAKLGMAGLFVGLGILVITTL